MAQTIPPSTSPGTASRSGHRHGPGHRKKKFFLLDLYSTAVGKKYVMAITGIMGIGYVVAHMIGNLKMYLGKESDGVYAIDHYGEFLRELLVPIFPRTVVLWGMRLGLIAALVLHLHAAYSLTILNRRARPVKYQSARDYQIANFASRTMRLDGHHRAAVHRVAPARPHRRSGEPRLRPRRRPIATSTPRSADVPVAIFYILANLALGVHLYHGTWSLFQSIGWANPRFTAWRRYLATGLRHRRRGRQRLVPCRRARRHRRGLIGPS